MVAFLAGQRRRTTAPPLRKLLTVCILCRCLLLVRSFPLQPGIRSAAQESQLCVSSLQQQQQEPSDEDDSDDEMGMRRSVLSGAVASFLSTAALVSSLPVHAQQLELSSSYIAPSQAEITDKVFFDVRISRQDGTFYVRDDLPDLPENRVFYGRLKIGLFGKAAPRHVQNFLSYITIPPTTNENDSNYPSYSRSQFPSIDQATGLLSSGKISGLQRVELSGSGALQYYGRIMPAALWIDGTPQRISHSAKGLLTHARFDVTPAFGITTRQDTTQLDGTHTVFAQVLLDESSSREFLSIVQDLPTYGGMDSTTTFDSALVEEAASAVFAAQNQFFRSAAKTFGDSRLEKVYEGKFLRRVEVTQVGIL
jgi:cyclophilin family peptidyl-prolyl cis-trans isomerase